MELPQVTDEYFQERKGIIAFSGLVNDIRCVWRETPNADVGIDGQVEFLNSEGRCTGQIVAVQVKSGPSYLKSGDEDEIVHYPGEKHRNYWANFPIPVILVIYDPSKNTAHWVDARQQLRAGGRTDVAIRVPRSRILTVDNRNELFETAGPVGGRILPPVELLTALAQCHINTKGFRASFFEMFGLGIVDGGRKLFFSMGLCMDIAESHPDHEGFIISAPEFSFIDEYIRFLVSQGLIYYDYSDYLIDRDVRQLVPVFVCSITARGQMVLDLMHALADGQHLFYEGCLGFEDNFRAQLPNRIKPILAIADWLRKAAEQRKTAATETKATE